MGLLLYPICLAKPFRICNLHKKIGVQLHAPPGRHVKNTLCMIKKVVLVCAALLGAFATASAQGSRVVLYSEDFNGRKLNDLKNEGWIFASDGNVHITDDAMLLYQWQRLVTPHVSLQHDGKGFDEVLVSFRYKHEVSGTTKTDVDILVRTTDPPYYIFDETYDKLQVSTKPLSASNGWQQVTFSLKDIDLSKPWFRFYCRIEGGGSQTPVWIEDLMVLGIRHDRGALPDVNFYANKTIVNTPEDMGWQGMRGGEVNFYNVSANTDAQSTYLWEVMDETVGTHYSFQSGYSATTRDTKLVFKEQGAYSIRLTVRNANGEAFLVRESYILVECPSKVNQTYAGYIHTVKVSQGSREIIRNVNATATQYKDFRSEENLGVILRNQSDEVNVNVNMRITNAWALHPDNPAERHLRYGAWVNWNNDWSTATLYQLSVLEQSSDKLNITVQGNIAIPEGQKIGIYSMRLVMANGTGSLENPCAIYDFGEIEDYALELDYEGVMPYLLTMARWSGAWGQIAIPEGFTQNDFTVEGWFSPANTRIETPLVGKETGWGFGIKDNKVVAYYGTQKLTIDWPGYATWAQIVLTKYNNQLTLRVSQEVVSASISGAVALATSKHVNIANQVHGFGTATGRFAMDELRIWKHARSDEEIAQYKFEVLDNTDPDVDDYLVGYYQFNDASYHDSFRATVGNYPIVLHNKSPGMLEIPASEVPYKYTGDANLRQTDITSPSSWSWGAHEVPSWRNGVVLPKNARMEVKTGQHVRYKSLLLESGTQLTVQGTINLSDRMYIHNHLSGPVSILGDEQVTVADASYKARLSTTVPHGRNWYMGSTIAHSSIHELGGTTHWYNTVTALWETSEKEITPMEGLIVSNKDKDLQILQDGSLHTGDQTKALLYGPHGWNLVANPYQSYVDLSKAEADTHNAYWDFTDVQPTVWFRTVKNSQHVFATYNVQSKVGANFPSDTDRAHLVAPGQAFWVRAKSSASPGTFGIATKARTHHTESRTTYRTTETPAHDVLRLELRNDFAADELALVLRDGSAQWVTAGDSEKKLESGDRMPNLYALKQSTSLVIANFNGDAESHAIPLGIRLGKAASQNLRLAAGNLNHFQLPYELWLEDTREQVKVNLRTQPEYAFTTESLAETGRFVLHLQRVATSSPNVPGVQNEIRIWSHNGSAIVELGDGLLRETARARVYGVDGVLRADIRLTSLRTEIPLPEGISLVEVVAGGSTRREKILK